MTGIKLARPIEAPIVKGGVTPFLTKLPPVAERMLGLSTGLPVQMDSLGLDVLPEFSLDSQVVETTFDTVVSDYTAVLDNLPPDMLANTEFLQPVGVGRFLNNAWQAVKSASKPGSPIVQTLGYVVPAVPIVIAGAVLLTGSSQAELIPAPLLGMIPFAILSPLVSAGGGEKITTYTRHPIVTGRSLRKILSLLRSATNKFNRLARSGQSASVREVPVLDVDGLVRGSVPRSVLSVGEGDSSFVHKLIELRAKHLGKASGNLSPEETPYFAVDRIYPDENGQFIAPRVIAEDRRPSIVYSSNPYHSQHPAHYRQGHAQDFELIDPKTSERMQFDEVVSLVSVGRFMQEEFMRSEKAGRLLLLNLLNHTKPGGYLRIVPVSVPLFGGKAFRKKLNDTLSDLQNEGVIDFYNPPSFRNNFLIIRKAEPLE